MIDEYGQGRNDGYPERISRLLVNSLTTSCHEGISRSYYSDPKTKEEFTIFFVAGWISYMLKQKRFRLFLPYKQKWKPSKKLKKVKEITTIKVIQKGNRNGNHNYNT
jgi:hypothetical protein